MPKLRPEEKTLAFLAAATGLLVAVASFLNALPPFLEALSKSPTAAILLGISLLTTGLLYFVFAAPSLPLWPRRVVAVLATVACVALSVGLLVRISGRGSYCEHFDDPNKDSLISKGWHIVNRDDGLWNRPDTDGCLTLFTGRGDNWTKSGEVCPIPNLIVRRVDAREFVVTTKVVGFKPYHNWQQGGLIIMDDDDNYVRFTFAFDDVALSRPITKLQVVVEQDGEVIGVYDGEPLTLDWNSHRLWLRIERHGEQFLFSHKLLEFRSYEQDATFRSRIRGKYVAIAAFQGCTEHLPDGSTPPIDIEPVAVDFDSFRLMTYSSAGPLSVVLIFGLAAVIALAVQMLRWQRGARRSTT